MNKIRYIKTFINEDFFELPKNKLVSIFTAHKLGYTNHTIETIVPYLFVVNKTSEFDKHLVTRSLNFPFVFLRDDIVEKIANRKLSSKKLSELKKSCEILKDALISIVVFPQTTNSYFAEKQKVDNDVIDFLFELEFNIKFFSLINTSFCHPVWTREVRKCDTLFNQQFNMNVERYKSLSKQERQEKFCKYLPSSASVLMKRYNPRIRSHHRAECTETVFYCCPSCEKFFTLYSEFNCLKCSECGTALEFAFNGNIELSSQISNLDDFADFQRKKLKSQKFGNDEIVIYEELLYMTKNIKNKFVALGDISATFYKNKVHLQKNEFDKTYTFEDILDAKLLHGNILQLSLKDDFVYLKGTKRENFLFFIDLFNLSNKKD